MRYISIKTVKTKLIVGFTVLFALVIANGAFGISGITDLSVRLNNTFKWNTSPINDVSIISRNLLRIRMELWRAQAYQNKDDLASNTLPNLEAARDQIEKAWKHYYPAGISSGNERITADLIRARLPVYLGMVEYMVTQLKNGEYDTVKEFQKAKSTPVFDELMKNIEDNIEDNVSQAITSAAAGQRIAERLKVLAIGVMFIAGILTVFVAIILIKLNVKLEGEAVTDSLTGLHNRRHFNEVWPHKFNRARRTQRIFSFCVLDIDNFKKYNDLYGHPQGDLVLQQVAKALRSSLQRATDFVFRLGGEEFGMIYETQDVDAALLMAERARRKIEELGIVHAENPCGVVSASFGLVCIHANAELKLQAVYALADKALYAAKEAGKNRVVHIYIGDREASDKA